MKSLHRKNDDNFFSMVFKVTKLSFNAEFLKTLQPAWRKLVWFHTLRQFQNLEYQAKKNNRRFPVLGFFYGQINYRLKFIIAEQNENSHPKVLAQLRISK